MKPVTKKSSRISTKLAMALVIIGVLYCLMSTGLYFYLQYPQAEKEIQANIERILDATKQPATQAVFNLDEESAFTTLDGLSYYDFIVQARIDSDTGDQLAHIEYSHVAKSYPILVYQLLRIPTKVTFQRALSDERFDEGVQGVLEIEVDLLRAHDEIVDKLFVMLAANAVQVLLFVIIIFWIVHYLIAKRLLKVSQSLETISPEAPNAARVPEFDTKDEIGRLSATINRFIEASERHFEDKNEAEKGLRYLTQHLEEVITKRTEDLEKALKTAEQSRDEADNANRAKSIFLSNMSHELRTPLNAIIGFTHRILKKAGPELKDRHREGLERVYDNGQYLLNLVNDLLDLAKIEAEKMSLTYQKVDLSALIKDCVEKLKTLADAKSLSLSNELPANVHIEGDKAKLQQVFINLISNSIKYTPKGSIKIFLSECSSDLVKISVQDTGIGIKEEHFEKLFDPYNHVHSDLSDTVSVQSTGLGLPLANKLVTLHGGSIIVESEFGQGSIFHVLLPIEEHKLEEDQAC